MSLWIRERSRSYTRKGPGVMPFRKTPNPKRRSQYAITPAQRKLDDEHRKAYHLRRKNLLLVWP